MSATATVNRTFVSSLESLLDRRLGAAVQELERLAKQRISTPYPPAAAPLTPAHRRTGGLQDAVFSQRAGAMDWVFGVDAVATDPARPNSNRERLGLWMELGTGVYRTHPDGKGGVTSRPAEVLRTSVQRRSFLLPTLVEDGPRVIARHLGGGGV